LSSVLLKLPSPLQAHEPQNKLLQTLLKNQLAIKIDQAFTKDTTRIKKPGIKRMNVERVVKVD
jgi:hypothetical protein